MSPPAASRAEPGTGRRARIVVVAAALVVVASGVAWTTSRAGYYGTTPSAGVFQTGSIALTDDDLGSPMFVVTDLEPNTSIDRCIEVTFTGSLDPQAVRLFSAGSPSGSLDDQLTLRIDRAADGSSAFPSCSAFVGQVTLFDDTLATFHAAHDSYENGLATWDPPAAPGGDTRRFRFRISVPDDPAAYGQTAGFGVTWETRS